MMDTEDYMMFKDELQNIGKELHELIAAIKSLEATLKQGLEDIEAVVSSGGGLL